MTAQATLPRQFVKLCDRRDFDDERLRATIRDIVPGRPEAEEVERKNWEYAMLAMFLEDSGRLTEDTDVLAVGAGHEHVLYWLANRVRRVVATDIYGDGTFAGREADDSMLTNPAAFAPYPYPEDRLEVHHMDARELEFEDESFDVVFSLSSIEHFGSPADIRRASSEIGRVLRPGGHAFIATECFLGYGPLDVPAVHFLVRVATLGRTGGQATPRRRAIDVFTARELMTRIVEPSGLELVQPLDTTVSQESYENVATVRGDNTVVTESGVFWPHVVVQAPRTSPWTSVALAFEKPATA
jgi:SAM-dependent methyltransferase